MKKIKIAPQQTTRILIFGLGLVALLLVSNLILKRVHRLVTNQSLPILPKPEFQAGQPYSIEITKISLRTNFELPEEAIVYQGIRPPELETICQEIAELRQLSFAQKYLDVSIWRNGNESLYCNPSQAMISWNREAILEETPDQALAKQNTAEFVNSLGLAKITESQPKVSYFNSGSGQLIAADQPGEVIRLQYPNYLDKYRVYQEINQTSLLVAYVDGTNTPYKLEYAYSPLTGDKIGNYPLLDQNEAERQLQAGFGLIIDAAYQSGRDAYGTPAVDISKMESAQLTIKEIVYVYSENERLIVPCFLITGSGKTKDGKIIDLEILLPAISERFLKSN